MKIGCVFSLLCFWFVFSAGQCSKIQLNCTKISVDIGEHFQCSVRVGFTCESVVLEFEIGNGTVLNKTINQSKID